jgi:acetylornithine/succinyldiaminopimelate/putrescine aminotransferase
MDRAAVIENRVKETIRGQGVVGVRGKGAMLGMQLESYDITRKTVEFALERGVLLGWTLHSNTLVRLAPPLIIDDDLLDEVLQIILESLGRAHQS